MARLSREIVIASISDFGPEEMLTRLSHPHWFQALGCVLGFDWHSSGVTTTVCGAIKEGIKGLEDGLGFFAAGGKGSASRKTPAEIASTCDRTGLDPLPLIYASRLSAKVDSAAVQDGYQLYHHVFLFIRNGHWAVVQQGMNESNRYARRYHWLGEQVADFVNEPHSAILSQARGKTMNLVAGDSAEARTTISGIVREEKPEKIVSDLKKIKRLDMPARHYLATDDLHPDNLNKILLSTYERKPADFERLLGLSGVGPKTIRALSLISELIYGTAPSYRDPALFSFAHGGKDGIPYPVDRMNYDRSIEMLSRTINRSKLGLFEKREAMGRLDRLRRNRNRTPSK
jgi:hypothetical protein